MTSRPGRQLGNIRTSNLQTMNADMDGAASPDSPFLAGGPFSMGATSNPAGGQAVWSYTLRDDTLGRSTTGMGTLKTGWLYKRFGKGPSTEWRRLWVYLTPDRLCYSSNEDSQTFRYVPLDRLSLRPMPHRQHEVGPYNPNHPDVGVAIVDNRVLTGFPADGIKRSVISLTCGSHTLYFAADSVREAQQWVAAIREAWLHCFAHTARESKDTMGGVGYMTATSTMQVTQRMAAENAQLRESLQELQATAGVRDSEYWKKWVEEKARNQQLQAQLEDNAPYEVTVVTSDIKGAGTDARVYIEIYGAEPDPEPAQAIRLWDMDSEVPPFKRGATDVFMLVCRNIGTPGRIRIWHDNTGRQPDWHLAAVHVRKQGARDWVTFPCNRWLSTNQEDGRICRELLPGTTPGRLAYEVTLVTSDTRGAGTDANVYLQLHGTLADGARHELVASPGQLERGCQDTFTVLDLELGDLQAVTVGHDGSGGHPAWHLDRIEVKCVGDPIAFTGTLFKSTDVINTALSSIHQDNGLTAAVATAGKLYDTAVFHCGAWLDELRGGGQLVRRLKRSTGEKPDKPWYSVTLVTSDIRGAGTDADVHIQLIGASGSSQRMTLASKPEHFDRGCKDTFRVQCEPLGVLRKLLVGHNDRGQSPGWHLSYARVLDEKTGQLTYFTCDRWLGKGVGDGVSEVTLMASGSDPASATCNYKVTICTSSLRGAGTDAAVTFELKGERGSSGRQLLQPPGPEAFDRGCTDVFQLRLPWLGKLQSCIIGHDNTGAGPAWHLDRVEVANSKDEQVVVFPCSRWIKSEDPKQRPSVELFPGSGTQAGSCRYLVEVQTSSCKGAGTDAEVSIELVGGTEATAAAAGGGGGPGLWKLDRPGAFERGQLDSFQLQGKTTGPPTLLRLMVTPPNSGLAAASAPGSPSGRSTLNATQNSIGTTLSSIISKVPNASRNNLRNSVGGQGGAAGDGERPSWHVEWLGVHQLAADGSCTWSRYFWVDRWLGAPAHPDVVELPASLELPARAAVVPYLLQVVTSDIKGAGTDANIEINLAGTKGESGWRKLLGNYNMFERGQVDELVVQLPDLGRLKQLTVRSDGYGSKAAWHLDKVVVYQPAAAAADGSSNAESLRTTAAGSTLGGGEWGEPVYFIARRWLDAQHGLTAVLPALYSDPDQERRPYRVQVFTGDVKGASTDADVFIDLHGDKSSSGACSLLSSQRVADATRKRSAAFERGGCDEFVLLLPTLGQLSSCEVWLSKPDDPWYLQLLVVTDPEGVLWYFTHGGWVGRQAPRVRLIASSIDPQASKTEYEVVTYTSSVRGAGTDANVWLELLGEDGTSSGRLTLPSSPESFDAGCVDTFNVTSLKALGDLQAVVIGHDGKGQAPAWHLEQVVITEVATGRRWWCECGQWLDEGPGKEAFKQLKASDVDPAAQTVKYEVQVFTSDRAGAGTTAQVSITLYGNSSKSSGRQSLKPPGSKPCFQQGALDTFVLGPMKDLGQLSKVVIGHNGMGASPAWHLHHLVVLNSNTGQHWEFPCYQWIGSPGRAAGPPVPIDVELRPGSAGAVQDTHYYDVAVFTSDEEDSGAGEDLVVTLVILGSDGEAGPLYCTEEAASSVGQGGGGSRSKQQLLSRGACDRFTIDTKEEIGQLQKLKVMVSTTGGNAASSWLLSTISITHRATGEATWFYAGNWLGGHKAATAPGSMQVLLLTAAPTDIRSSLVTYLVTPFSRLGQGPVGCTASIRINGTSVSSSSFPLVHPNQPRTRQQQQQHASSSKSEAAAPWASFLIRCPALGQLKELLLWLEPDGWAASAPWLLQYVEVQQASSGQVWYFSSSSSSSAGIDPATATVARPRLLSAVAAPPEFKAPRAATPPPLQQQQQQQPTSYEDTAGYRLTLVTGDKRGAGTDANVHVLVAGEGGTTPKQQLRQPGRNCFERGQTDVFQFDALDVSPMTHLVVGHDNTGLGPAWYLASAKVEHLPTGQTLTFEVNQWFDRTNGDQLIERVFRPQQQRQQQQRDVQAGLPDQAPPVPPATLPGQKSAGQTQWTLTTYTGTAWGAGTDADVWVALRGSNTTWGPSNLPAGRDAFESGQKDSFQLATPQLGELQEVALGHNGRGQGAAWFLDRVELFNHSTGQQYTFRVGAWLDNRNSCRVALPASAGLQPAVSPCCYQLELQTSNQQGAGTDADVLLQLHGTTGATDVLLLAQGSLFCVPAPGSKSAAAGAAKQLFTDGARDVFHVGGLMDIGHFTHALVALMPGHGPHAAWHLGSLTATNTTTGATATLPGDCWVGLPPGSSAATNITTVDGVHWVTLELPHLHKQQGPAAAAPPAAAQVARSPSPQAIAFRQASPVRTGTSAGYQVTFYTSNILGAGTDAKVFFELNGELGTSEVIPTTSERGRFQRGHTDTFLYPRLPRLGQLKSMRVACKGGGLFAAWHLRSVEVVHVPTGERTVFDCHDWIDSRCNWQRVLRATLTLPASMTLATLVNMGAVYDPAGNSPQPAMDLPPPRWQSPAGQALSAAELQQAAVAAMAAAARARSPSPASAMQMSLPSPRGDGRPASRARAGQLQQDGVDSSQAFSAKGIVPVQQPWQAVTY